MSLPLKTDRRKTIHAGWLVGGRGDSIQKNVRLTIDRHCIESCHVIDPSDQERPDLDLGDCLVLPGLIDCHVHLCMSGTADAAIREWQLNAPYDRMRHVIERHLEQHLGCGVAAVRDGGDYAAHVLRFKHANQSSPHYPLTFHTPGRAWRHRDRYGKLIGRPPRPGQTLAEAIRMSPEAVDHVKIVNSGLNSLKTFGKETAPQFPLEELRAAVQAAKAKTQPVMVHVNGRDPVRQSIMAGCDSIEHGFFMGPDNLQRLADSQTFWVPTTCTMQGYARHAAPETPAADVSRRNLDHQLEQMRRARELGVKVALGTDAGTIGVHHGKAVRMEMELLLTAGFTIPEAVQCATRNGARVMGMPMAGVISPGAPATLLALPGGPQAFPANLAAPVWFILDGQTIFDHRI